jgi:hypothetical protein
MIPRHLLIPAAILFALATGMGIYVIRLQPGRITARPQLHETEHVSPPPPSAAVQTVTVWIAHDDSGTLRAQSISVPSSSNRQQHAEDILHALLKIYMAAESPHRMGPGSEICNVFLTGSDLGNPGSAAAGLAVIDVNSAFAEDQTSGVLAEDLTLVSFVQTLSTNVPGLVRVKFLVDGKERETLAGHADLTGFYDISQVAELAKQLSAE